MAFKAGAIYGEASLNTAKWKSGLTSMTKGVTVAAAAIAAAFTAAMAASIKSANEFQKAMSNVSTLLDTTTVDMQGLAKSVLTLSPELGNATELTKGLYQAFSAGAETADEAMQTTTDAAMFAKAALTDTFTAVDALTTAVNAYGKETMTTTKASDLFFQTIKFGKITGEELAATIGTSIPLFANTGIALEELTAGLAAMTKQGINAHQATTQLNAIVNMFLKPSEEMTAALEDIGYESGAALLKAEGLAGALDLVQEATGGDAAKMAELLPNVRALRGAMALSGIGGEEFTRVLKEMENAAGSTKEAFDKQEKTFETFRNSMSNLKIVVGNIGKAFLDDIVKGATESAISMQTFLMSSRGMEIVANIAGGVAGAFELIKGIVTPLFNTFKTVYIGIWEQLVETLQESFGITLDGAGAFKILSIAVNLVSSGAKVFGQVIIGAIKIIGDWITAIRESAGTIGTFFSFLKGEAEWQDVKDQARSAGDAFKTLGKDYIGSIGNIFTTVREEVSQFSGETDKLATDLSVNVKTAFNSSADNVRSNWDFLVTGQQDNTDALLAEAERLRAGLQQGQDDQEDDTEEHTDNQGKLTDERIQQIADEVAAKKELWDLEQMAFAAMEEEKRRIAEEAKKEEERLLEERRELWNDYFRAIKSAMREAISGMQSIYQQYYTNQKAEQDLWYQAELAALDNRLSQGIITEEEYKIQKEQLDEEANTKANELAEKQFKTQKKFDIAAVWMDAGSSIAGWWRQAPNLGPFAGPIFAGVMTGLTLAMAIAQTALISKQKFVPSKQEGGMASGLTRINERGGEIINLPDGSIVIPNDISEQIARAGGSSAPVMQVSFDGAKISNDIDLERVTDVVARKLGRELRFVR